MLAPISENNNRHVIVPGIIFPNPMSPVLPLDAVISANNAYAVERSPESSCVDRFTFHRGDLMYRAERFTGSGTLIRGSVSRSNQICLLQGGMDMGLAPVVMSPEQSLRFLCERRGVRELDQTHNIQYVDSVYPEIVSKPMFTNTNYIKLGIAALSGIFGGFLAKRLVFGKAASFAGQSLLKRIGGVLLKKLLLRGGVSLLFGGVVGLAIGALLFASELTALSENLELYRDFQDPHSEASENSVRDLDQRMRDQGFIPESPAYITYVGHSGAGAIGTMLAARSNAPNSGLSFRVRRLVLIASPLTTEHLENIPPDVEVVYAEASDDDLHSFAYNYGWLYGLDVKDVQSYSATRNNIHFLQLSADHMSSLFVDDNNNEERTIQQSMYRSYFTNLQMIDADREASFVIDGLFRTPPIRTVAHTTP